MKYFNNSGVLQHTFTFFNKAIGKSVSCIHFDLRVPKGTILVIGHVLCNELNKNKSSSNCLVIRKLYRNIKRNTQEYDAWHIWCSIEERSINKLRNKFNVLCAGQTENGKVEWDILCSRKHSQGKSMKEFNGGLEVFMGAGNLGGALPPALNPNASDNLGGNL